MAKKQSKIGKVLKIPVKYHDTLKSLSFREAAYQNAVIELTRQKELQHLQLWEMAKSIFPEGKEYQIEMNLQRMEITLVRKYSDKEKKNVEFTSEMTKWSKEKKDII